MATQLEIAKARANLDRLEARMEISYIQYERAANTIEISDAQEQILRAKYLKADLLARAARRVWGNMLKDRANYSKKT